MSNFLGLKLYQEVIELILHRKDDNKKEILIYDYVDDNFAKTRNMFLKRKKTYEKLGYEIVEDNEQQIIKV